MKIIRKGPPALAYALTFWLVAISMAVILAGIGHLLIEKLT